MDSNKDLDSRQESSKKKQKKSRNKEDITGPTLRKHLNQLDKCEKTEE